MRTLLLASMLVVASISPAVAQVPQASLDREFNVQRAVGTIASRPAVTQTPPKYCKPCLFYAGDFDSNNSVANGIINEFGLSWDGEAYVPFVVPKQQKWHVTGLLVNLIAVSANPPKIAEWQIRKGVKAGSAGTLIEAGTSTLTFGGYYNCGIEFGCYGMVAGGIDLSLSPGRYWMSVVPQCMQGSNCDSRYIIALADVEDVPPPNRYGPLEPWDDSFWSSKSRSTYFQAAESQCGYGCDRFSTGVLGTKE